MKAVRVPGELVLPPYLHRSLQMEGFSVVESCTYTQRSRGSMFLDEHLLLHVLKGQNTVSLGKQEYPVKSGQMLLISKASLIGYDKQGDAEAGDAYESLLFFFTDSFIRGFLQMSQTRVEPVTEAAAMEVKTANERMRTFFASVMPYFAHPERVDKVLLQLKMQELLFNLVDTDKNLLHQLLELRKPIHKNIVEVMEENYAKPVNIEQLAYLSGRSLSTFKREFAELYDTTPAEWIRNKRLEKAKQLLENSNYPVADICYTVGFENPSHFSRIFKRHFGHQPTEYRN
ncbi:AraC family transcriptional regulator [Proteiniphilum sp. X52]|uniref:helix-turn-helix domain-containing protein n=1 Tax=Proteiniphilum sp. X52 TaxID=2382159 RepID=UPI000F0A83E6|nr:AraC family transcriptional regulator [Proteiniphilum sp. X52]RNC67047.1 AraC family transcriptional regulator [Proteiniphilum sp. X52]